MMMTMRMKMRKSNSPLTLGLISFSVGWFLVALLPGLAYTHDSDWKTQQLHVDFGLITSLGEDGQTQRKHTPPISADVGIRFNFIGISLGMIGYGIDDKSTFALDHNIHVLHLPIRVSFYPSYSFSFLEGRLHLDGRIGIGIVPTTYKGTEDRASTVWSEFLVGGGASFWINDFLRVGFHINMSFMLNSDEVEGFFLPVLTAGLAF